MLLPQQAHQIPGLIDNGREHSHDVAPEHAHVE
jgi:hypothetical protein